MKKVFILSLLFMLISSLLAHEFWLHPDKFIYKRGEKINIRFLVGENFEGENWKGNNDRVQMLTLYYGGISDNLSEYLSDAPGDSLELTMLDEGTCLVAFNSTNSFIEMEAAKFNEYLLEDGLANAIEYRKQYNETDSMGREYYQRCAKTMIQVGNLKDKTFTINSGMPVDIIPLMNPYQLKNNDSLRIKILYEQVPLAGALVKIWHRENGATAKQQQMSNEKGEIIFSVKTSGAWMVSVVKMKKLENDEKADWQSYWGSLTWGYE